MNVWTLCGISSKNVFGFFSTIIRHMKKSVRLFLLCLMMIAIPVQGIAATAMLYCCSGQHQSVTMSGSDQHLGHSVSDKQSHSSSLSKSMPDHSSTSDTCSSCADCYAGSASTTPYCGVSVVIPSSEKTDSIFSSHSGHVSDGLERPPRN